MGGAIIVGAVSFGTVALANGYQEDGSWQFQTSADKANLSAQANIMQLQRGGYYDSFHSTNFNTNNYTTNFAGSQINCSVSATSVGNSGTTTAATSTSSPVTSTSSNPTSTAMGNSSSYSIAGANAKGGGTIGNSTTPTNTGAVGSSVGSSSSTSGAINASGGTSTTTTTTSQTNAASQMASINDSKACGQVTANSHGPMN
jgi:hypothetical protein